MKQYITDAQTGEIITTVDDTTPKNRFLAPGEQPPPWHDEPTVATRPVILGQGQPQPGEAPPGTALVRLNPGADEKIMALSDEILKIFLYANSLQVTTTEEAKMATNDLTSISNMKKAIEEKRKEYKAPILDYGRQIDHAFEMVAAPLESADKMLRQKLLTYNQKIEAERQRLIDINRLKEETARLEAEAARAKGQEPPPPPALVDVPDERNHVRADIGTTSTQRIIDKEKVDEAVAKGCKEIPGIHIWFEPRWKVLNLKTVPRDYLRQYTRVTRKPCQNNHTEGEGGN